MIVMTPIAAKPTIASVGRGLRPPQKLGIRTDAHQKSTVYRASPLPLSRIFDPRPNIDPLCDLTDFRQNKVQRYLPTSEINIALWPTHRAVKAYL